MLGRRQPPVMVTGPGGELMPQKAADAAWAIYNRKQARLAALAVDDRKRTSTVRAKDTDRDQARKDRDVRAAKIKARWDKISAKATKVSTRLRNDLPLAFTLFTVGVSLTVTLAGQWMFYSTLPWPAAFAWLPIPMALLVESGSWTYGIQARHLAEQGHPYGAKSRMMWLLALLAAGMNSWHGAHAFPGHPEMGIILGGGSVLGPLTWHGYLHITKRRAQRRSGTEIRAGIGRRLHRPILTWQAHKLWSDTGGRMSPEVAFLTVFRERYGYLPGRRPGRPVADAASRRPDAILARHMIVAVLAGGGAWYVTGSAWVAAAVNAGVLVVLVWWTLHHRPLSAHPSDQSSAVRSAPDGDVPSARSDAAQALDQAPEPAVPSGDVSAPEPPSLALVGGDGSGDGMTLTDQEIERFMAEISSGSERPTPPLHGEQNTSSDVVSGPLSERSTERSDSGGSSAHPSGQQAADRALDPAADPAASKRRPVGSRTQRKAARAASNKDRVRDFVDRQLAGGQTLESITAPPVARALKIGESTARKLLAEIKSEINNAAAGAERDGRE